MGKCVPPPPGLIKINVDASVRPYLLSFGVNIVAGDEHGVVVAAKSASIKGKFPPYLAEMYVVQEDVRMARHL